MKMNLEIDILSQKFPIFVSEMIDIEIEVFFSTYESKYSKSFKFTYVCYNICKFFYGLDLEIRHISSHFRRESDSLSAAAAQCCRVKKNSLF